VTWIFQNDFGEDLLSKVKDFSRSQAVTYNDNISETVLDSDVTTDHKQEVILVYGLSNSNNCNNLECS